MIALRWRETRRIATRWRGPSTPPGSIPATNVATSVATVIGPRGRQGVQGPVGPTGEGATDPGDLTLYFENHLI